MQTSDGAEEQDDEFVSIETEDGDTVIYQRDNSSNAWIRSDKSQEAKQ